jgi:GTP-binding protein
MAERGEPGKEMWVRLELRLIADVAIVGIPNAGKSTLLAAISNAKPKIAEYPFTTLAPNLGVVELPQGEVLVVADIPGLIEGAHEGVGLGFSFLRHIQRTRAIIHLLDGDAKDPIADLTQVNSEMALFDPRLEQLPQLVAINKVDLPPVRERLPGLVNELEALGYRPVPISALAREGLDELLRRTLELRERGPASVKPDEDELPVYRPEAKPAAFTVLRDPDGVLRVSGEAIERSAAMTYWEYRESVRRFQRLLERIGVEAELRNAGIKDGQTVRIGEYELEWQE